MKIYVNDDGQWNTSPFLGGWSIEPEDAEPPLVISAAVEHAQRAFARVAKVRNGDTLADKAYDVEAFEGLGRHLLKVWDGLCSPLVLAETDVFKETMKMWNDVSEYVQYMDELRSEQ